MTTSLPPDAALYHAQAKVFQRSAGRSAVAAAAYRSASRLTDDRIGQVFDYTKKHVVAAFIVAPEDAPAWVFDRQELWNRAEFAEVKRNAVVAREWEISIPRDIPPSEREAFARKVVEPWIMAGAIADIAIHCPPDVYGNEQPHAHVMLTTRVLDPSTETGFSKKKNDVLTQLFESGGRHGGGKKADALKMERERISGVMNRFLEAAGSPRRTSHLSNMARYPDHEREPEPTMGEGRLHASRKRKRGDHLTKLVGATRAARSLENQLIQIEENIMSTNPKFQSANGIRPAHQQNFKTRLFNNRFPDVSIPDIGQQLYMVDVKNPSVTRIQTRDGGWVEVENRMIKTYGEKGFADTLAKQLYDADYGDHIERLDESARITRKGQGLKLQKTRHVEDDFPEAPQTLPKLPESLIESTADKWRSRGYTDITEALDGVYVKIGGCRIQDLGDELRIHGKATDPAVKAMVAKAMDEWGGEMEVFGSRAFKDAAWIEAQRQGAVMLDAKTSKPYEPSPEIKKRWEADLAQALKNTTDIEGIRQTKKVTEIMRNAASGDKKALENLQKSEPYLAAFLIEHLDEDQLRQLANESDQSLEEQLDGMRELGREYADDGKEAATVEVEAAYELYSSESPEPDPEDEDNQADFEAEGPSPRLP